MNGWNCMVRLHRSRAEILNGMWQCPEAHTRAPRPHGVVAGPRRRHDEGAREVPGLRERQAPAGPWSSSRSRPAETGGREAIQSPLGSDPASRSFAQPSHAINGPISEHEPSTRKRRGNRRWQPRVSLRCSRPRYEPLKAETRPCTFPNQLGWRSLAALLVVRSSRSGVLMALVVALLAHESRIEGRG